MAVMIGALGVQMTAQVALSEPTPAGWLVAAMPATSFILIVKLALRAANLPVALERGVAQAVERARAEGRPVTAEDIRRFTRAPAPLAQRILGDLLNH